MHVLDARDIAMKETTTSFMLPIALNYSAI